MSFISARNNAGISRKSAADALGVSDVAVCLWETGRNLPKASLLPKIAELYGCSIEELLKDNPTRE